MRKKFLVCSDYGMGGTWAYLLADSEEQILQRFRDLAVVHELPGSWSEQARKAVEDCVIDIDSIDPDDPSAKWLLKLQRLVLPGDAQFHDGASGNP